MRRIYPHFIIGNVKNRRENGGNYNKYSVKHHQRNDDPIAIRDGKTNGEMKAAIEAYKKADEEMYEFLLEQTTKN